MWDIYAWKTGQNPTSVVKNPVAKFPVRKVVFPILLGTQQETSNILSHLGIGTPMPSRVLIDWYLADVIVLHQPKVAQ